LIRAYKVVLIRGQSLLHRHLHHRALNRKDRKTLCLMVAIIPLCCLHQAFSKKQVVNGFLFIHYPLETYWYVKFMCAEIAWVLVSIVVVRLMSRSLKPFGILFLSYCVFNLAMFFINCNSVNYYYLPLIIIAFICNKVYS
jgi:hypothetical protein